MFRSWGRVGTKIGDNKLEKMYSKEEAIEQFVSLYEEKTGNAWKNRHNFEKHPGKLYPLDIDYGDAAETVSISVVVHQVVGCLVDQNAFEGR